jgi:protein-tyrosine phosphatase
LNPYWIEAEGLKLAILPRPRGQDWLTDDVAAASRAGVDIIISALTEAENEELGLAQEAKYCRESGIELLSFPIEDRSLPASADAVNAFLHNPYEKLKQGRAVAIHCRAGIGRSSLLCASLLVKYGWSADAAFDAIQRARGCTVPDTREQREWVESFAASLDSM